MTKEDEAHKRAKAAEVRLGAAELTKKRGQATMWLGVVLGVSTLVAFTLAEAPEIVSWVRQVILTLIAIVLSAGIVFFAIGQSDERRLAQAADDRAAQEARHDEEMALLREIKRSHTFLVARLGAGDAVPLSYSVRPSEDTLDMLERQLRARQQSAGSPRDVVDPKYLADMSEAVRLGEELANRKRKPPDPPSDQPPKPEPPK